MAGTETPKAAPEAASAASATGKAPAQAGASAAAAATTPGSTPASGAAPGAAPAAATPAETAHDKAAAAAAKAQAVAEKAKKALGNLKHSGAWNHAVGITKDLISSDQPTRKMARYFFVSVAGIVFVLVASGIYFHDVRLKLKAASTEQGKNLGDFLAKQAEEAKLKFTSQSLGTFSIELKTADGVQGKRSQGVMNLAEIEIVVTCDEKETCDFLEDNMPQVRNQLTDVFTAMERDDLLSKEGKRRLKGRVLQKLNLWLPKGKIENLYFDKLVVS
jgi:flagellar basal body-associated protein FliL